MTRTGCCGWAESQPKYFQDFKVLEIQDTFYQPGRIKKYEKWRARAPYGFDFLVKAWQLITHEPRSPTYRRLTVSIPEEKKKCYGSFRPTEEVFGAWDATVQIATALRARTILFQSPASFLPNDENRKSLRAFFSGIDRSSFILAWEPRGGWEEEDIQAVCKDFDLVHCVDPLKARPLAGQIRYFRLHGLPGYDLKYKYSDEDLCKLSALSGGATAYVLFNNVWMLEDAKRFLQFVGE